MYYDDSDVKKVLEDIKEKYLPSQDVVITSFNQQDIDIEKSVNDFRLQLLTMDIVNKIFKDIQDELFDIGKKSIDDYSLDVPTKCDGCFAERNNGICGVCAFTGDLSDSGFYDKYGIMENCPFLTQKQIDDLAYNFIQQHFDTIHQDIIDDLDTQYREDMRKSLQERFDEIWGGKFD